MISSLATPTEKPTMRKEYRRHPQLARVQVQVWTPRPSVVAGAGLGLAPPSPTSKKRPAVPKSACSESSSDSSSSASVSAPASMSSSSQSRRSRTRAKTHGLVDVEFSSDDDVYDEDGGDEDAGYLAEELLGEYGEYTGAFACTSAGDTGPSTGLSIEVSHDLLHLMYPIPAHFTPLQRRRLR